MNDPKHWDQIYSSQSADNVGWYRPHLETPLAWIDDLNLDPHEPIIDVGGGASTLVDDLLERGHKKLTVLDLSKSAIQVTQKRLGDAANTVTWLVGDVTEIELLSQYYLLWHDRAVFHFLVDPVERSTPSIMAPDRPDVGTPVPTPATSGVYAGALTPSTAARIASKSTWTFGSSVTQS